MQSVLPLPHNIDKRAKHMPNIRKDMLTIIIIISGYFLVTISEKVVANHTFEQNITNNPSGFQPIESVALFDHYFFSYNVIDHDTLLIKFDITRTALFQQAQTPFDGYLYVSKLPETNYKINIGPFSGVYERAIDGTIFNRYTFCLLLIPSRNRTAKTIFHKYLQSSFERQRQHILHYCTKMEPDENHLKYKDQHGSGGDLILFFLQVSMIFVFLFFIQLAHKFNSRKHKDWRRRQIQKFRKEFKSRKQYSGLSPDELEILQLTTIDEEELENKEEGQEEPMKEHYEEEDDHSLNLFGRELLSPIITRKRTGSFTPSDNSANCYFEAEASVNHILDSKPWL